jgi:hypothetical protein
MVRSLTRLLGVSLAEHWTLGASEPAAPLGRQNRWPVEGVGHGEQKPSSAHPGGGAAGVRCRLRTGQPRAVPASSDGSSAAATARAEGTIPCRPLIQPEVTGKPRFTPLTRRDGDTMVLPVVFPDGSTAELRSPRKLDLATLGVWARTSGVLGKDAATGRDLLILYGNAKGLTAGKAPVACYQGADRSQVELWRSQDPAVRFWLLFQFGAWTVALWDGNAGRLMGHQDRAVWARSLVGRETEGGWLVLRVSAPCGSAPNTTATCAAAWGPQPPGDPALAGPMPAQATPQYHEDRWARRRPGGGQPVVREVVPAQGPHGGARLRLGWVLRPRGHPGPPGPKGAPRLSCWPLPDRALNTGRACPLEPGL